MSYDASVLARVITDSLDGLYDDGNGVFTSACVRGQLGRHVFVTVTQGDDDLAYERRFKVTVKEIA